MWFVVVDLLMMLLLLHNFWMRLLPLPRIAVGLITNSPLWGPSKGFVPYYFLFVMFPTESICLCGLLFLKERCAWRTLGDYSQV